MYENKSLNGYEKIAKTALNNYPIIPEQLQYLAHSDNNEQIKPIDFARCGFGYYLYDIASALQYLSPQVRTSFLSGYQTIRNLPDNHLEIIEAFFLMAIIDVFSNHVNNPQEHEWLAESVPYIAEKHIFRFLKDEPFLLNLY